MDYNFNFNVVFDNIDIMLKGLGIGLLLAVISLGLAVILGLIVAFGAVSNYKVLKRLSKGYVTVLRNTPLLVLIYIVYFGLPDLGITLGKEESFVFTLSLYGAAYMTEVFRAGLEGIPTGIIEAGKAIGLKKIQIVFTIELPIMFRTVLPSMGNYLISLFKDTALAASIAIAELTYITRQLNTKTFRVFEVWLATAILYVVTCYLIAFLLRFVERKMAIK